MEPTCSLIVPVCNNGATVEACLRSLRQQSYGSLEFLVVDDSSTDDTLARARAAVEGDSRFIFLQTDRRSGAATARNLAMEKAQGELLVFIDGDMEAPSNWVETLVKPILKGEADGAGGPDLVKARAPLVSRCIGYSMDSWLLTGGLRHGTTRLVKYLPGTGNLALKAEVVREVGYFCPAFHDYGEDKEFLYRVRFAGYRFVYVPEALAWHHRPPDSWLHFRKQFISGQRRVDIWRTLPGTFEWAHAAPALLIGFYAALTYWPRLFLVGLLAALLALTLDAVVAVRRLGDPRALVVTPWTSLAIPLGYGLGIIVGLFKWLGGRPLLLVEKRQ